MNKKKNKRNNLLFLLGNVVYDDFFSTYAEHKLHYYIADLLIF